MLDGSRAPDRPDRQPLLARSLLDLAQMLRFYSRLPVPRLPFEEDAHAVPDFRTAPRMLPLAGAIVGTPAALALVAGDALGLPDLVTAGLALSVLVASTGAFHEDGLADTADGLGGGATPERRLDIMKDSRIGTYGAAALGLALLLRAGCLAGLLETLGGWPAAACLIGASALSRALGLLPLALLPPARPGGFSAGVGRPTAATMAIALGGGGTIAALLIVAGGLPLAAALLGGALATLPAFALLGLARRLIGGQTGDIAGAAQQGAEIAFLCGLLIYAGDA